jgi:hypothetical protein
MLAGNRLHRFRLLAHARLGTVELEEQRGLGRVLGELRKADARVHLHVVEELDARDGNAELHRGDHRVDRALQVGELAHRRGDRLRQAVKTKLHLGDDAERAFGADEEPRQVVAGARFARTAAGAHDAAIRRHDGQPEHVLAHGAVAHRVRARGARRRHAADRRVRPGVDREEEARSLELRVQLLARHAGLDPAIEILRAHLQHAAHLRKVEAYAAVERRHVTLERRADAERDHRNARLVAHADDGRDLLGGLRKHDDVGHRCIRQSLAVRMLLPHRAARDSALAVLAAQLLRQPRDRVGARPRARVRQSVHAIVPKASRRLRARSRIEMPVTSSVLSQKSR